MYWTEIVDRKSGDVTIVDVRGHLTLMEAESSLFRFISRLMEDGKRRVVLNLRNVSYIDSIGIGEIVRTYLHLTEDGGMLVVCAVSPRTREVLETTRLDSVIRMFDTEEAAVQACGGPQSAN